MSAFDGFSWLNQLSHRQKIFSEESRQQELRILRQLLQCLGHPEKSVQTLHIAGSKGKGSTGLYLEGTLRRLGYQTLLFTSPHVFCLRERILVNGQMLNENLWNKYLEQIFTYLQQYPGQSFGYFDVLTILAFLLSRHCQINWLILETGIGGRLDTTNLCSPAATLITQIELEHTHILGDRLEQIAYEKSGILKESIPLFLAAQTQEVLTTILYRAQTLHVPVVYVPDYAHAEVLAYEEKDKSFIQKCYFSVAEQTLSDIPMCMLGNKQCDNALLALLCLQNILPHNPNSLLQAWLSSLQEDSLPGRFSIVQTHPLIVLDGCHTVESVADCVHTWTILLKEQIHGCLIFSCKPDKNIPGMIPYFNNFYSLIITGDMQPFPPVIQKIYPHAIYFAKEEEACAYAKNLSPAMPTLAAGSFYSLAKVKKYLLD